VRPLALDVDVGASQSTRTAGARKAVNDSERTLISLVFREPEKERRYDPA